MQLPSCDHNSAVNSPRDFRRSGFTLVELLVVIGIIALLMSILLPTLGRVREQAKATQCMSNLRSFGQVLHIYAANWNGRAPIGYANGKHAGYMIHQSGAFRVMGVLSEQRLFDAGIQGFYCPSKEDPRWQYNTPENPWPPPVPSNLLCRLGMTLRPAVNFGNGMAPTTDPDDDPQIRGKFPQLNYFRNKAVAAEMFAEPVNAGIAFNPTITSHKKLINVYYEDNSCQAVPTTASAASQNKTIAELLEVLRAAGGSYGSVENEVYLYEGDPTKPKTGIWHIFDEAH